MIAARLAAWLITQMGQFAKAVHLTHTLRPYDDNDSNAITGGGPTCGDPDTVSSMRPEHSGTLAESLWLWLLEQKFDVTSSTARSCIDNMAVITRMSTGHDDDGR